MSDSSMISWPAPTDPRLYVYDRESPIDAVAIPTMVSFSSLTTTDRDTSTTTTIGLLSRDPIGYEGSQWNLYEYVGGNPLIGLDPSGLACRFVEKNCTPRGGVVIERGPAYRGARLNFAYAGNWEFIGLHWTLNFSLTSIGPSYWKADLFYNYEKKQDEVAYQIYDCLLIYKCDCPDEPSVEYVEEKRKQWEVTRVVGTTVELGGVQMGTGTAVCMTTGCIAYAPNGQAGPIQPNHTVTPVTPPRMPGIR